MRPISKNEFAARPDHYLDLAREQDVRIRRGRTVYHLVCEPLATEQPLLAPDEKLRNAITAEELLRRIHAGLERKWAERRK